MEFPRFLLDEWLAQKHTANPPVEFDLGSRTGPVWTLRELLSLEGEASSHVEKLLETPISYVRPDGTPALREAIAEAAGCDPAHVQATTGGAEALMLLFAVAAKPGANVVLPSPGYPAYDAIVSAFGIEPRYYALRQENGFRVDVTEIAALINGATTLVVVNSPHNPTGATLTDSEFERLHDLCADRGVQFLSDEVYHPIYHGTPSRSAARLPRATVLGDFSKAMCLSGLRIGWIIEPDDARRRQYCNARSYFTVCSAGISERLGALALRHREKIYARAQRVAAENLTLLEQFFAAHSGQFVYSRPRGGMTAFVRLKSGEDGRALCSRALAHGILLAPGDCFGMHDYFRIGFAASAGRFEAALERLSQALGLGRSAAALS